jgi:hypothetical protein
MKNEILNKGLEATIDSKQRTINNLVFMLFVMVLTAFVSIVLLAHRTKESEAKDFQISQRDSIIHMHEAHINELTYDNINLVNQK